MQTNICHLKDNKLLQIITSLGSLAAVWFTRKALHYPSQGLNKKILLGYNFCWKSKYNLLKSTKNWLSTVQTVFLRVLSIQSLAWKLW